MDISKIIKENKLKAEQAEIKRKEKLNEFLKKDIDEGIANIDSSLTFKVNYDQSKILPLVGWHEYSLSKYIEGVLQNICNGIEIIDHSIHVKYDRTENGIFVSYTFYYFKISIVPNNPQIDIDEEQEHANETSDDEDEISDAC